MSGTTPPGSPPPEVPEEFAAAYRAAYEQALAAQTSGPTHRDVHERPIPVEDDDGLSAAVEAGTEDLPQRHGPLRIGTHRSTSDGEDYDDSPTWTELVTDSRWLVPFLLLVLALLLVFGTYSIGRRFAEMVASDSRSSASSSPPAVVISRG